MTEPHPTDESGKASSAGEPAERPSLAVLGGFKFRQPDEALVTLTGGSQRLLAFLALRDQTVSREATAGTLYPDSSERHAYASLRSTLSRLPPPARRCLLVSLTELCLADGVAVDLRDSQALAHRILSRTDQLAAADLDEKAVGALSADLLPGWYDEWVMVEAEDWRQLRLHALEALAARLTDDRRYADAAASALAAIKAEPLRESARGALIRVHLAEGNQSEAIKEFDRYRSLLQAELGLEPTDRLRQLVSDLIDRDAPATRP